MSSDDIEARVVMIVKRLDLLAALGHQDQDQTISGREMRHALAELCRLGGRWTRPYPTPRRRQTFPLTTLVED